METAYTVRGYRKTSIIYLAAALWALLPLLSCNQPLDDHRDIHDDESVPDVEHTEVRVSGNATDVESLLSSMTVEQKVGQLLMIDLFSPAGDAITHTTDYVDELLTSVQPGGVVMYGGNIDTVSQITKLISDLQDASALPLFVAVDHEGGIVNRFDDSGKITLTEIPAARVIGDSGDVEFARGIGEIIGTELSAMGFNMNFAPVADISLSDSSVIGSRSYGSDPKLVGDMVAALVGGMQDRGVSAVLKHFPGHGAAVGDTHSGHVVLERTIEELQDEEFVPFSHGIASGADGVMIAHLVVPAIDADRTPATSSKAIITGLLRDMLSFKKIAITDSLTMGGAEASPSGTGALDSILAGTDMLLRPDDPLQVKHRLLVAVEQGELPISRLDESVRRVLSVKAARKLFDKPRTGSEEVL